MRFTSSPFFGIDPGLTEGKLALSVVHFKQHVVQSYGVKPLKGITGIIADTVRCEQVRKYTYQWLKDHINNPLYISGVCVNTPVIAIEAPAFSRQPARSVQTGVVHAALYRAILDIKYACVVVVVPPTVLKKYVTGKGNANKELMMEAIINKWFSKCVPFFGSQDLYEAYALAEFGRFLTMKTKDKKIKASVEVYEILNGKVIPYSL